MKLMTLSLKLFMTYYFILTSLWCVSIVCAQDSSSGATHGLAYENPIALSPAAFEFFHPDMPKAKGSSCKSRDCSPSPGHSAIFHSMATKAHEATQVSETSWSLPRANRGHFGAGGIVGIVFGIAFIVLIAMGVYYVMIKRRTNIIRRKSIVEPDV
ncbi:hypothetical protein QJS04_geneDACA015348 [Acorus gramineus]|uniref:Transmembrane protein n=1 Tax=Acorus gramineus TaxID=55184 RepID=A0AAV9AP85_ACOGR|nr:hypothetical protein QJS04_geneDACA015348 [Acorus gramineus]